MDGGLGRDEIPVEDPHVGADLPRVADALSDGGFSDEDVRGIMGGNWFGFSGGRSPAAEVRRERPAEGSGGHGPLPTEPSPSAKSL